MKKLISIIHFDVQETVPKNLSRRCLCYFKTAAPLVLAATKKQNITKICCWCFWTRIQRHCTGLVWWRGGTAPVEPPLGASTSRRALSIVLPRKRFLHNARQQLEMSLLLSYSPLFFFFSLWWFQRLKFETEELFCLRTARNQKYLLNAVNKQHKALFYEFLLLCFQDWNEKSNFTERLSGFYHIHLVGLKKGKKYKKIIKYTSLKDSKRFCCWCTFKVEIKFALNSKYFFGASTSTVPLQKIVSQIKWFEFSSAHNKKIYLKSLRLKNFD